MGKLRALKRSVTNLELKGFWDVKIKKPERFGENWLKERVSWVKRNILSWLGSTFFSKMVMISQLEHFNSASVETSL